MIHAVFYKKDFFSHSTETFLKFLTIPGTRNFLKDIFTKYSSIPHCTFLESKNVPCTLEIVTNLSNNRN